MALILTQNEIKKASEEELNRVLTELEALSDEEAYKLLADESTSGKERLK